MNIVALMGRLTADAELRRTPSDKSVARFTVAVNRQFKNDKGEYDADFISCQAWGNTADFVSRYFHKGDMIALTGSLRTGSYTDRNHNDVTHYTTDVVVNNVEFCGSKKNNVDNASNNVQNASQQPPQNQQTNYTTTNTTANTSVTEANTSTEMNYGNLAEFEEILSDGDVPF